MFQSCESVARHAPRHDRCSFLFLVTLGALATIGGCGHEDKTNGPLASNTIDVPASSVKSAAPSVASTSTAAATTLVTSTFVAVSSSMSPAATTTLPAPTTTRAAATTTSVTVTTATTTTITSPPPPTAASTAATPTTPSSDPAAVIWLGNTSQREVALTFDAGSDAGHTATILDVLASNGIRATFALTGEWVEQNPALARRIASDGHDVMNHSYDHPSFTGVSSDDVALTTESRWDQLDRAENAIRSVTGQTSLPYFRPPFGDQDASVAADTGARGYRYLVMWTVDSLGWTGLAPSEVVRRCVEHVEPGAILMFHVGSASTDAEALQDLIDQLSANGYRFATLPELIG